MHTETDNICCTQAVPSGERTIETITGEILALKQAAGQAIGVKEDLAMYCEKFGDVRVVSVTETRPEQLRIGGNL